MILILAYIYIFALPVSGSGDIHLTRDQTENLLRFVERARAAIPANDGRYLYVIGTGVTGGDMVLLFSSRPVIASVGTVLQGRSYHLTTASGQGAHLLFHNSNSITQLHHAYRSVVFNPANRRLTVARVLGTGTVVSVHTDNPIFIIPELNTASLAANLPPLYHIYLYSGTLEEPLDLEALRAALGEAGAIIDVGYNGSSWNLLQASISSGQQIYDNPDSVQDQIDSAVAAIELAIGGLVLLPTIPDLQTAIDSAVTIVDVGFTLNSWGELQSSISDGQEMLDSREYTQNQLSAAYIRLDNAVSGLTLFSGGGNQPPNPPPGGGSGGGTFLVPYDPAIFQQFWSAIMTTIRSSVQIGFWAFGIIFAVSLFHLILRKLR